MITGYLMQKSAAQEEIVESIATPGLTHTRILTWLDKTGLPPWFLGLGSFIGMTLMAFVALILARVPDPDIYRNAVAFVAVISFFLIFYFRLGRGWHSDVLLFLEFDPATKSTLELLEPSRKIVAVELLLALVITTVNLQLGWVDDQPLYLKATVFLLFFVEYATIIFCVDIIFRHLASHDLGSSSIY